MYNFVKAKVNVARIGYAINNLTGSLMGGSQLDDQPDGPQSNTVTMDTEVATITMTGSVGADDSASNSSEDLSDLDGAPQQHSRPKDLNLPSKPTDISRESRSQREGSLSPGRVRENPFNKEEAPPGDALFPQLSDPGNSLSPTGRSSSLSGWCWILYIQFTSLFINVFHSCGSVGLYLNLTGHLGVWVSTVI
jgi:hypothetical protein